jgi:hypothetical protein
MFGKKVCFTVVFSLLAFGAVLLMADDSSARARLVGAWQPQDSTAKDAGVWTLERKGDEVMHISYSVGDQKMIEFECGTTGKECKVKDSGKSATVSLWFNGSRLVALETRGQEVLKRRFAVGDGDSLEVEVIPIQPDGKSEKVVFRRIQK